MNERQFLDNCYHENQYVVLSVLGKNAYLSVYLIWDMVYQENISPDNHLLY